MLKKIAAALIILSVCAAVLIICRTFSSDSEGSQVVLKDGYARVCYLNINGYDALNEICKSVRIPDTFEGIYKDYAQIQKQQGLPLEEYKGKTVKRFIYEIRGESGKCAELVISGDTLIASCLFDLAAPGGSYPLLPDA